MRDVELPPDEAFSEVRPDDPEEQRLYLQKFRGRFPHETASLNTDILFERVCDLLKLCPELYIRNPRDVLRFFELNLILLPQQDSPFLMVVQQCVLEAVDDWSATKRLDFIFKHIAYRPTPNTEPDFGPWYQKNPVPPI